MIEIQNFNKLIGQKVRRFLIVVWPPIGEAGMSAVDMSIGLILDEHEGVFHIQIDKDDLWTPIVSETCFDEIIEWRQFQPRIDGWMKGQIDGPLQHEVFDATHESIFGNIVSREILDIECITLKSELNPFAIKICFRDDYLLVSPISDGTTIETSLFNKSDNLKVFRKLGELELIPLRDAVNRI
ncbi:hypothetical protein Enr10x_04730 [Gimesia panareensis]|uniref:Uncharacterized protein n=1 Tax=Gimesia panareensis TaxID=2527978 RepID=A0A517Q0L1_9PLAN|nr:hypothetical protein [Gimesia panareensis]QDT25178.1 hypothetical protein Enr10x_04730 [Gimesia panareensis]